MLEEVRALSVIAKQGAYKHDDEATNRKEQAIKLWASGVLQWLQPESRAIEKLEMLPS